MKVIALEGFLSPWAETGTEGVIWTFQEDGEDLKGYEGCTSLRKGMY